jgi:sugar phosphate isomerase/epimerase
VVAQPLAVQLYTFRDAMGRDPAEMISRIAEMGFVGVEAVSAVGAPDAAPDAATLKPLLDANGLTVCAAHVALLEWSNASALFDGQEELGNDLVIVSGAREDFATLDAVVRFAERMNEAASLVAARGMRLGYHTTGGSGRASLDTSCCGIASTRRSSPRSTSTGPRSQAAIPPRCLGASAGGGGWRTSRTGPPCSASR